MTPAELLWTEIGASFCWMVVTGLLALFWSSRERCQRGVGALFFWIAGGNSLRRNRAKAR